MNSEAAGDVAIVGISGDITLSQGGDVLLKDKIQSLLQQGHREDRPRPGQRLRTWTARGSGSSCRSTRRRAISGGSLKLVNLTKRLRDLLVLTKLLTVFDAYDSESEAVASFK